MKTRTAFPKFSRYWLFSLAGAMLILLAIQPAFQGAPNSESIAATYTRGTLHLSIPYDTQEAGAGRLLVEVLDPEGASVGSAVRRMNVAKGKGWWQEEVKLTKELSVEDLVWHRVQYAFSYTNRTGSPIEGTESISEILRMPMLRILGQQSYLAGGQAAVRVIATDSKNENIPGASSVRVELGGRTLFTGALNQRGTTEAQFRLPSGLTGTHSLRYVVDTPIGSTEYVQQVRLEDKAAILLTTEKPLYQPGQTIHVRALALDRSNHEATANRPLTFELEDSRGNKVFKKTTQTDKFGIASAEFGLADEVNLGTYHLRALMGDASASPISRAEIAVNVERYVLPKFKVAVEFTAGKDGAAKHGYRPGDRVTGTVRVNYFFGKPVENAEITVKASGMDVERFDAGSVQGKTDGDGAYRFDLPLPKFFAGRPLSNGVARVLIEASVKDSAGHAETRGEPVTVSESPLIVTAIPEGGTLIPNLENQIFVLTSYADGKPARANVWVDASQSVATDEGGVAVVRLRAAAGSQSVQIVATDAEGNRVSRSVQLQTRGGQDQILLRTEHAVYRAGDRIQLRVFSTKKQGTAYIDVVKDGQTILTRDLEIRDGQAQLALTATPDLAGTVDFSAYLFGADARPIGDHRLIFVQPADELKIEATTDAPVYKPGDDARIRFRVTNARGEGVQAALGLQVVDEAVFALAEKQPGFAKVFFYLEQEAMKPRYEIHSIGMPDVVAPVESAQSERRDRAARALFAATEMVSPNKFETEIGRSVPQAKYAQYAARYQARFQEHVRDLAQTISRHYEQNSKAGELPTVIASFQGPEVRDAWNTRVSVERAPWAQNGYYTVRSAGADKRFNTRDDAVAYLQKRTQRVVGRPTITNTCPDIEDDRGALDGLATISGSVMDASGAVVPNACVALREVATGKVRNTVSGANGEYSLESLPTGEYDVEVFSPGFKKEVKRVTLKARDHAVLATTLQVGAVAEMVTVESAVPMLGGLGGNAFGERKEFARMEASALRAAAPAAILAKDQSAPAAPRVRSYFPEALYINPRIITDQDGRASIAIPMADSITIWRMAMLASTVHGALGSGASSIKVFQDFFVDLDLPVTLTQGDRVSIPVAIYNYSAAGGDVSLQLQPADWFALVNDNPAKTVAVESGRVGGSQFTLEAKRIGKFKLTLSARMKGGADIVVREIEVVPNGREQSQVFNGRLETSVQHQVNFPTSAIADASKIFVRLYPGPLSQVIEGMDSILRMPGGCFEQTSSSTYPNILALDYMKRMKKATPEVQAKAEGYIANGYQRLLTFEVPGGGFSWFGQAPANKILTAYGLMEFYDMSKVYDVDPKIIQRTQQWLASQQQADGSWKPDTSFINEGATNRYNSDVLRITAYIAWSLGNTGYQGPAVEKARQYVAQNMNGKLDAYTLAVLANFAADYGKDRAFTRQAMQLLLDARTEQDEQAWWNAQETSVYSTGASAAIETTGLATQALLKWGEASSTARKSLAYIASKKDATGAWGTTQATIMALRALLLSTSNGSADVRGEVEITLNGNPVERLTLTADNSDLLHQFVFKNLNANTANSVGVRFNGKGGLAYQVVGNYFLPWTEKPANEPLSIEVTYDRTRLAQDEVAMATATVKNKLSKTANMLMIDLGVPPGFDLLTEDLQSYQEKTAKQKSGRLEKFSLTATQAILYFNSIAQGDTITLRYRFRAKYPIRARTFQSRVYEYYDPAVSSVARPVQLEVVKR